MSETVGQLLRATREAKGQTLEDVEAVTRIRARHLSALEADDYAALPSPAQARGFVKNYAEYLELDIQDILGRYEEAHKKRSSNRSVARSQTAAPAGRSAVGVKAAPDRAGKPAAPAQGGTAPSSRPVPAAGKAPKAARAAGGKKGAPAVDARGMPRVRPRRLVSADLLVAVVITLLLGALLAWGGLQLAPTLAATPTLMPVGAVAGTDGTQASTTPTRPPPATATPVPPTPAAAFSGVNVTVRAELRSWVGVKVDGAEVFAGLMPPGEAREFIGLSVVEVVTGNGKGTRVIWNGVDQGLLGDLGEVVVRLWTMEGMVIPTPTATREVTGTPSN